MIKDKYRNVGCRVKRKNWTWSQYDAITWNKQQIKHEMS